MAVAKKEPVVHAFPWQGARVAVVPGERLSERLEFERFARDEALALLRAVHRDPIAMAALRQVLRDDLIGERIPGAAGDWIVKQTDERLARMNDADVMERIRLGVTMERFVIVREKRDWRLAPRDVAVVDSPPPATPPPPPRVVTQPPVTAKKCCCTNPACAEAFDTAAANGTPMVERGGPNC
jgi:hypothetical protein